MEGRKMSLEYIEIPKIADDEDMSGWFRAIAQANGWDYYSFERAFIPGGTSGRKETLHHVKGYSRIFEKYRGLNFPEPKEALMAHTEIPLSGLFMAPYYAGMEADMFLNGADTEPFTTMLYHEPFRYCPECAREDIASCGRRIVHIPHQVSGVSACYRHGVRLSEDAGAEAVRAEDKEVRTAQMVSTLYRHRAVGSINDVKGALAERASERGIKLEYQVKPFVDAVKMHHLASLFTDEEILGLYKKNDSWLMKGVDNIREFSPESHRFTRDFPFLRYTCGECGTENTVYAYTPMTGGICPVCAQGQSWQEKTMRRLRCCLDPEYEAVSLPDKKHVDILHRKCGKVMVGKQLRYMLRNGYVRCDRCMEDEHNAHIGESRVMNCGMPAEITAFRSVADIDVRFADGSVKKGAAYQSFLDRCILPEDYHLTKRIGETRTMDCGADARVIRAFPDGTVDVMFLPDGEIRCGVSYTSFRNRDLKPENFRTKKAAEERMNVWKMMNCGQKARVVRYGGAKDCDVEFEDGAVLRGVRYAHFKEGALSPAYEELHRGEKRTMRNGLEAEIVECPNARHVKVLLGNGDIVVTTYRTFLDGYVGSETLRAQQRDSHIGEPFHLNCGLDAVITEYIKHSNCTVRFSNGEVRTGVSYAKLKLGKVLPPSMQHRSRVGDTYKQECGQYAEVIGDKGVENLTVRFENGLVREHVKLADLKKGTVEPLTRLEKIAQEAIGKENLMSCGIKAKIVAYRSATDIDVLFETGELREHVRRQDFKKGAISPVPRRKARKSVSS